MELKLILAGICLSLAFTCQSPTETTSSATEPTLVSADSLMENWNVAWNAHDSATVANFFHDQSVVIFSTSFQMVGRDSIVKNWVRQSLPTVTNLKTQKISSVSSSELAYYSGSYSLNFTQSDSTLGADTGIFTIVWKLQPDQSWKIENMIFGAVQE
ncbi:MAG: DUF4440 domain-containing protein [Cyclobacteriaceae bacterium]|nr:DUF4440 domain-containing protein [Cyclobacteriaceae bacterium]MDX5466459.1 DUF4440 domain-containing protein [Cyclobacteriaceae bacterium]